jgi:hypothetical protein
MAGGNCGTFYALSTNWMQLLLGYKAFVLLVLRFPKKNSNVSCYKAHTHTHIYIIYIYTYILTPIRGNLAIPEMSRSIRRNLR